ncbi:MAG: hypothetical protein NVSMB26_11510 [Beijerinckiaceae bacterium]
MSEPLVVNLWTFLLLTCVIGGAAAIATGRAIAATWRPPWHALAYMIPLTGAVRFLHYALFGETLIVLLPALLVLAILLLVAAVAFRITQARQMVRQYPFAYAPAGPLTWKARDEGVQ